MEEECLNCGVELEGSEEIEYCEDCMRVRHNAILETLEVLRGQGYDISYTPDEIIKLYMERK